MVVYRAYKTGKSTWFFTRSLHPEIPSSECHRAKSTVDNTGCHSEPVSEPADTSA